MATLKECVESGRRWRWKGFTDWMGPGHAYRYRLNSYEAMSDDFEIEPEPEKPREKTMCQSPDCPKVATRMFCSTHGDAWVLQTFKNVLDFGAMHWTTK